MINLVEIAKSTPASVKRLVPNRTKERIKVRLVDLVRWYRKFDSKSRALPSFIIAGAQKSGTTTLYTQLSQHPNIVPALQKEINYFNINYGKGFSWYRANFPILPGDTKSGSANGMVGRITGEATPGYMPYPYSFERIAKELPNVKIIMMLRNPVDRAYSSYFHQIRKGREKHSFEEAILLEKERLVPDLDRMSKDKTYYAFNYRFFSYLTRGVYINQILRCFEHFPKQQVMILESERFFADNKEVYNGVLEFLELPGHELSEYKNANKKNYETMDPKTRSQLIEYFRPYNAKLYELIGRKFDWDK